MQQQHWLGTALALGAAFLGVVSAILAIVGSSIWFAVTVLALTVGIIFGKIWLDKRKQLKLPKSLGLTGFSYPQPDWLSDSDKEKISNIARAAFLLLAFERTDTGCWSKTNLYRLTTKGEPLPLARGALTGTPWAVMAMCCYASSAENKIINWAYPLISETFAKILTEDGGYLRRVSRVIGLGSTPELEPDRHAAGACFLTMMCGTLSSRDLKTLVMLSRTKVGLDDYSKSMIARLLIQSLYVRSIPAKLRRRASIRVGELLQELITSAESRLSSQIWANNFGHQEDTSIQWATVSWLLPILQVGKISLKRRRILEKIIQQFLLAQAGAEPTGRGLLPSEINTDGVGSGEHVFGTGLAVAAWRSFEIYGLSQSERDKQQASENAKRVLSRLIESGLDIIEFPSIHLPGKPQSLEGYGGWGGLCLAAASLGITLSAEDCERGLRLARELDAVELGDLSEKQLAKRYSDIINEHAFLQPSLAVISARTTARIALEYKRVLLNETSP